MLYLKTQDKHVSAFGVHVVKNIKSSSLTKVFLVPKPKQCIQSVKDPPPPEN